MTATSFALTTITLGVTLLRTGDAVGGLKVAGEQISAAGNARVSRCIGSTGFVKSHSPISERNDSPGVQALSQNKSQITPQQRSVVFLPVQACELCDSLVAAYKRSCCFVYVTVHLGHKSLHNLRSLLCMLESCSIKHSK
jgi:hypothetical protein